MDLDFFFFGCYKLSNILADHQYMFSPVLIFSEVQSDFLGCHSHLSVRKLYSIFIYFIYCSHSFHMSIVIGGK